MESGGRDEIILCPGVHKTATTALQATLTRNRAALRERGIHYFERSKFHGSALWPWLDRVHGRDDPADVSDVPDEALGALRAMFPPRRRCLLSVENLFGDPGARSYPGVEAFFTLLRRLFPDRPVRVILYVRRQDTFLESMYMQRIHKGFDERFTDFWRATCNRSIDWARYCRRIEAAMGRGAFVLRAYEGIREGFDAYARDFYALVAPGFEPDLTLDAPTNRTLGEPGYRIAKLAFPLIDSPEDRRRLIRIIQPHMSNAHYPRVRLLKENHLRRAEALFAASNATLFDRFDLPPHLRGYYAFEQPVLGSGGEEG